MAKEGTLTFLREHYDVVSLLTDSSFLISKEAACFSTHVDLIKVTLKKKPDKKIN